MKREFTTVTQSFGLFPDVFDLNAIFPKVVYKISNFDNLMTWVAN